MKTPKPVVTYDVSRTIKIVRFSHNPCEQLSLEWVLRRVRALGYRVPKKVDVVIALRGNIAIANDHLPVVLVTRGNNGSEPPSRKAIKSRSHQHITTATTILSDNGNSQQNTGWYQHMPGTTNFVVKAWKQ